jgi:hypothetical protein
MLELKVPSMILKTLQGSVQYLMMGVWMKTHLSNIIGDCMPKLAKPDQCSVTSKSQDVAQFVSKAHYHLLENKVFHQFHKSLLDVNVVLKPWAHAHEIDNMIRQALKTAGKKCAARPVEPWSSKLHHT